ncbi:hypothetical protein H4Q26_001476 [Puccinia striiformis f. sp. tritici PST-130]|nr:hypothetical protein H4Q26_001476 [Puccinia striiformis f. sp. tritici PST-130]
MAILAANYMMDSADHQQSHLTSTTHATSSLHSAGFGNCARPVRALRSADKTNNNNNHQQPAEPRHSSSATLPATAIASSASVFSRMTLEDVLEDLASRFILNLPIVELSHIERVCFQVEQAHWFLRDFVRPNSLLNLPSYHLKTFTSLFFEKCEFLTVDGAPLAGWDPKTAYEKFMRYKERVPVCGAIMFNEDALKFYSFGDSNLFILVFPRGKINENELPKIVRSENDDSKLSAIRKTRPTNPTPNGQHNHHKAHQNFTGNTKRYSICYPTRQEIGRKLALHISTKSFQLKYVSTLQRIAWFPISDLPTFSAINGTLGTKQLSKMINVSSPSTVESQRANAKFYMVVPFVNDMRTWLTSYHLLASLGQPVPALREHHQRNVQTPPYPVNNHNNHGNGYSHTHSTPPLFIHHPSRGYHTNSMNQNPRLDNEAAAVHERASRLEAFDFCQDEMLGSPDHINQDTRLTSSNTRKKNKHIRHDPITNTTINGDSTVPLTTSITPTRSVAI